MLIKFEIYTQSNLLNYSLLVLLKDI